MKVRKNTSQGPCEPLDALSEKKAGGVVQNVGY